MLTEQKAIGDKKLTPEQELARRTRRSFLALGAGAVGVAAAWRWLNAASADDPIPPQLRRVLGFNERVVRNALYSEGHLVKTYPASAIGRIKVNGEIGMDNPIDPADWHLELDPMGGPARTLAIEDVRSLPRHEETIDFKCVEGWSTVTQFAGARLSDFTARFAPGSEKASFIGMVTPSKDYYVGVDMPSALHPQTLLAYEMNGKPLEDRHGAPLRLVMPVKYGIKNIKRIARIFYTNEPPADYWAEQGYDYYAGL
jgi:DMSO/TMAO reductase YedYZ molybdopterin-dependent catalytic subunit